jgi:hypothetical protein
MEESIIESVLFLLRTLNIRTHHKIIMEHNPDTDQGQ